MTNVRYLAHSSDHDSLKIHSALLHLKVESVMVAGTHTLAEAVQDAKHEGFRPAIIFVSSGTYPGKYHRMVAASDAVKRGFILPTWVTPLDEMFTHATLIAFRDTNTPDRIFRDLDVRLTSTPRTPRPPKSRSQWKTGYHARIHRSGLSATDAILFEH